MNVIIGCPLVLRLLHKNGELPKDPATNEKLHLDKIVRKGSSLVTSGVNVGAQDNRGLNAVHHLVEVEVTAGSGMRATYDNAEMLGLLAAAGVDAAAHVDGNGSRSALQMAEEAGAERLAAKLRTLLGIGSKKASEGRGPTVAFEAPVVEDGLDWTDGEFEYDVVADARRMLAQLEAEAEKNPKRRQKIIGTKKGSTFGSGRAKVASRRLFRRSSSGMQFNRHFWFLNLSQKSSQVILGFLRHI